MKYAVFILILIISTGCNFDYINLFTQYGQSCLIHSKIINMNELNLNLEPSEEAMDLTSDIRIANKPKILNDQYKPKYIEKSLKKRNIEIYILGNGPDKIAILGSMHGDEPQGDYMVHKLLEYIKNHEELLHDKQILLIPAINPDGLVKNTRGNANGVDLNRNFPTTNWTAKIDADHYPGPKPASEPETRMLIKYITEFSPELIINIHSPLKVINYDANCLETAKLMAKYNKYRISDDIGYPTPGSFGTYFGKERNIQVITLETGPENGRKAWKVNKEAIIEVIKAFPLSY